MVAGKGNEKDVLSEDEIREIIERGTPPRLIDGKKILVLTPDATRTAPLPMMVRIVNEVIGKRATRLDFMVALGTHKPLSEDKILSLYGINNIDREKIFEKSNFFNHQWNRSDTLVKIGRINDRVIKETTQGLFHEGIDIEINRAIFDYDLILILGPVFPHEIVGFSGGYKYLFPGISGGKFLHFFHWLGAVHTCMKIIGKKHTPVRTVVNIAAQFIKIQCYCISMVVRPDGRLAGVFVGSPEDSWESAADLSSQIHVIYKEKAFNLVLGNTPAMYDEIWTAGKVMYKLEPVVSDCGTLVIFGKHIHTLSHTWGKYIKEIGYHVRDYFLSRMDRFNTIPGAVLAHSTHVKGVGTFVKGHEAPRIDVVLATSIPEDMCRKINLGYMNPEEIHIDEYINREDEDILYVENAGEILFRLKSDT
jgi:nickel-dependent lactate racemase